MSASFNSSTPDATHMSGLAYGPPPGLASNNLTQRAVPPINGTAPANDVNASAVGESSCLQYQGREVSPPSAVLSQCGNHIIGIDSSFNNHLRFVSYMK